MRPGEAAGLIIIVGIIVAIGLLALAVSIAISAVAS